MLEVRTRAARSTASWIVAKPLEETHRLFVRVATSTQRARITSSADTRVEFGVRGNLYSWGEVITIDLAPTIGGTSVTARSRPTVPTTLFDWGEGARDIRALHDAVGHASGTGDGEAGIAAVAANVGQLSPWPKPFAWFSAITGALMLLLALVNLVINTASIGSWLPLLILGPFTLVYAIRSLRVNDRWSRIR